MEIKRPRIEGRHYAVATFEGALPVGGIEMARDAGADGIAITGTAARESVVGAACRELELRYLSIPSQAVRFVPRDVLARVEVLELRGRSRLEIDTTAIPGVRVLTVGSGARLKGSLDRCPEVVQVYLGLFDGENLRQFDHCPHLRSLKLLGRHQLITPDWGAVAPNLEHFMHL